MSVAASSGYAEPVAEKMVASSVSSFSNWPVVLFVLIGMIGFIFALGWFVKRFGGSHFTGNRDMKVVSSIALGARERIALVDIKGQQFLIGVTSQQITHLHSFDEAVIPFEHKSPLLKQSEFFNKLQTVMQSVKPEKQQEKPLEKQREKDAL